MAISSFVSLDERKRKNFHVSVSSKFNILKTIKSSYSFMDRNKESKEPQRYETLETIAAKDRKKFSYETIDAATNKFSDNIGEGGSGSVFKGRLKDGTEIAVKKLSNMTPQGKMEFLKEAEVLTGSQHRNVVKLLGYCAHNNAYFLVYEFLPYSLSQFLSSSNKTKQLDWTQRFGIIKDIARGLLYLHVDNRDRIVHCNIKPSNILLNQNMMAKIADFGLSRFFPEDRTLVTTTNVAGTLSLEFLDPAIADTTVIDTEEVMKCIGIALLCVQGVPTARPDVEGVMSMLIENHGHWESPYILKPGIFSYSGYRYDISSGFKMAAKGILKEFNWTTYFEEFWFKDSTTYSKILGLKIKPLRYFFATKRQPMQ
ncbi:putative receptor-like protein kinase [Senna tora]|uniref:non-specific serine/threonine protein kinase n=1 Tax=Senna tora TaxID=362788 RepID=A0A834W3Y7_9FABA|nr:putative receptor-like protein kinase [Senna tora]